MFVAYFEVKRIQKYRTLKHRNSTDICWEHSNFGNSASAEYSHYTSVSFLCIMRSRCICFFCLWLSDLEDMQYFRVHMQIDR